MILEAPKFSCGLQAGPLRSGCTLSASMRLGFQRPDGVQFEGSLEKAPDLDNDVDVDIYVSVDVDVDVII